MLLVRTDVDHLPAAKQREFERVVEVIFDEFRQANENATGRRKGARILKITLFGSHARDDWVDAILSANQFKSDYDLLVIVTPHRSSEVSDPGMIGVTGWSDWRPSPV